MTTTVTHTIGRRKTSIARIFMKKGSGQMIINGKEYTIYFPTMIQQYKIQQSFTTVGLKDQYDVKINVGGGGTTGQVEAIRLAIARALVKIDEEFKPALKKEGLITRDSRMVERKKFGKKKARKKFQFSKR